MAINRNDWINSIKQDAYGTTGNPAELSTATGAAPSYSARAWVNFDGTLSTPFAGGASTVTRLVGSTTATVTTTNNHNLTTGNSVWALSGVVAGSYTVTVTGLKTFTITTVATTALTNVAITFAFSPIRASGNVSSVTRNGTGDYTVNFATAMPDANYCAHVSENRSDLDGSANIGVTLFQTGSVGIFLKNKVNNSATQGQSHNTEIVCVSVFR